MGQDAAYRLRRMDRNMPDRRDQLAVLHKAAFLTLAMANGNEPYLVSLNYVFDESANCFYIHSATEGRKLSFLTANPRVWGQVVEDGGYVRGKATQAYRSVMFEAVADFITDPAEKLRVLGMLLDRHEPGAEATAMKADLVGNPVIDKVAVLRLKVLAMTGKQNPART